MESTFGDDESTAYLRFFNDQNYLLQGEGLSFPVDSVFAEIDPSEWCNGLPILLYEDNVNNDTQISTPHGKSNNDDNDRNEKTAQVNNETFKQIQAYKCQFCQFICEQVDEMTDHVNLSHNNRRQSIVMYVCSECLSTHSSKDDLKKHMTEIHKFVQETAHPSPPPQQTTPIRTISSDLVKKQKSLKTIKCTVKGCAQRFASIDSQRKHEACHIDRQKNNFHCTVCKKKFSLWRICSLHMFREHTIDLGLLACPMCHRFKSYSSGKVLNHMTVHTDERPFICSKCGLRFKLRARLREHESMHDSEKTQNRCELCDRCFADARCLKKHVKFVHDKFKPFICNICGHQTCRKETLQLHQRQHTGDKPFHCNHCSYRSADKNCLMKHTMIHTETRKYACQHCDYKAIQATAFKTHMRTRHPNKDGGAHVCPNCQFATINHRTYRAHVKSHELDKKTKAKNDVTESSDSNKDMEDSTTVEQPDDTLLDTGGITIPEFSC